MHGTLILLHLQMRADHLNDKEQKKDTDKCLRLQGITPFLPSFFIICKEALINSMPSSRRIPLYQCFHNYSIG